MRLFTGIFFLTLATSAIAGCKDTGKTYDESIYRLSRKFNTTFLINKKYKKKADSLCASLDCDAYHASVVWINRLPDTDDIKIRFSNKYGLELTFDYSQIKHNIPFLLRLIADKDTIGYGVDNKDQIIQKLMYNNYYLLSESGVVKEYDRTNRNIRSYEFTDSIIKQSMILRYGNSTVYDQTANNIRAYRIYGQKGYSNISIDRDTLCLTGLNTAATVRGKDTLILNVYSVVKYYRGKLAGIYPIIADQYIDKDYFFAGQATMCRGDTFYFVLGKVHADLYDNRIWGAFIKDKNTGKLILNRITPDTFPDEYRNYGMLYMYNNAIDYYPYYMLPLSDQLTNIVTGKKYILEHLFESKMVPVNGKYNQTQHVVIDFKIDKDFIGSFIINDDGLYQYVQYDPKNNRVLTRKSLWRYNPVKSGPMIDKWDHNYLVYMEGRSILRETAGNY